MYVYSSTNGYAFEAQEESKRNSYFVTEIVRGLNESNPANKEKIDIFLNKVCTVYILSVMASHVNGGRFVRECAPTGLHNWMSQNHGKNQKHRATLVKV